MYLVSYKVFIVLKHTVQLQLLHPHPVQKLLHLWQNIKVTGERVDLYEMANVHPCGALQKPSA